MDDRRYVIFDSTEINKINFLQVMETSADTLRKSVDGTKTFVKYEGIMPTSVNAIHSKSQEYTHSEIITILSTSEWTTPIENM